MNNTKEILADVSAIKKRGLEYYQKNYFWPVKEDDYNNFIKKIHDKYLNLISQNKSDEVYDIMLIEYSFIVVFLEGIFHYNFLNNFSKKENYFILSGNESKNFINPDWGKIKNYYRENHYPYNKISRKLRLIIKRFVFNRHLKLIDYIKNIFFKSTNISVGSYNILKKEFIEKKYLYCDHYDFPDLIPRIKVKKNDFSKKIVDCSLKDIINPFFAYIFENYPNFTKGLDINYIKDIWLTRVNDLSLLYESILFRKSKNFANKMLVTQIAKPFNKLLIIAYQRKGCEVYGFHHGNDLGLKIFNIEHQIGRAHVSNFVLPTKGIKEAFINNYSKHKIEQRSQTIYHSADSLLYKNTKTKSNKLKSNVNKKVMLMGYAANNNRYIHEFGQFFYFKINLEFNIIKFLKKNNYEVVYKVHPDRKHEITGLFEKYVDEYIVEPFEKTWHLADTYLFTDTSSSTFGFSLGTDRQIILFDSEKDKVNQEIKNLILKRIHVVNLCMNKNMEIEFDKQTLLRMLEKSDKKNDISFFQKMLI